MLPPPLPPFPKARDEDTEPGVGLLALKAENARLRNALADALEGPDTDTPPPLPWLRLSRVKLVGMFTTAAAVLALVAPLIEHHVPQYASLVHELAALLEKAKGLF